MRKLCFIAALFLFSCNNKEDKTLLVAIKEPTKLEKLMLLPKDSVILHYDLSEDSLSGIPNLSAYTILSLNLSHNQIDTIVLKNLPEKLEKLNLSHNAFVGFIRINQYSIPNLKELDISYNKITVFSIYESVRRLILSHNELISLGFNQLNCYYLDISYNPQFSNRTTTFAPDEIDTIVRVGIANNKMLYNPTWFDGGPHLCSNVARIRKMVEERDKQFNKIYSDSIEYRKIIRTKKRNYTLYSPK